MNKFCNVLYYLRTKSGLTIKQLAEAISVTDASVCRWENEQADIVGYNLIKLAKFFGVSTDYLLGLED